MRNPNESEQKNLRLPSIFSPGSGGAKSPKYINSEDALYTEKGVEFPAVFLTAFPCHSVKYGASESSWIQEKNNLPILPSVSSILLSNPPARNKHSTISQTSIFEIKTVPNFPSQKSDDAGNGQEWDEEGLRTMVDAQLQVLKDRTIRPWSAATVQYSQSDWQKKSLRSGHPSQSSGSSIFAEYPSSKSFANLLANHPGSQTFLKDTFSYTLPGSNCFDTITRNYSGTCSETMLASCEVKNLHEENKMQRARRWGAIDANVVSEERESQGDRLYAGLMAVIGAQTRQRPVSSKPMLVPATVTGMVDAVQDEQVLFLIQGF